MTWTGPGRESGEKPMAQPGIGRHQTEGPAGSGDIAWSGIGRPVARPGIGRDQVEGSAKSRVTLGRWPGRESRRRRAGPGIGRDAGLLDCSGPAGYHGEAWANDPAGNRPICRGWPGRESSDAGPVARLGIR